MSIAKQQKLREYGTDILSHDSTGASNNQVNIRQNNTFKSSVMTQEDASYDYKNALKRDKIFQEKPLATKVQRASYQDSNIFGYKDDYNPTIQSSASGQDSNVRLRQTATFSSRIFTSDNGPSESERPPSRSRQEEKWQSTVFEGPITEQSRRKKLGQGDAGVETLFGQDRIDFENKSNAMPVLSSKKEGKQWKPVRQEKTAEQRKNEELHGRSAATYGTGSKKDGTLMANNADWRNLQQTHVNASSSQKGNQEGPQTNKDKKYDNLSSNIFCQEEKDNQPTYDPTVEKAGFGTDANWTAQAGSAKIINKGYKQDPYKKKQAQLSSQVFDLTDYSEYQPMNKPKLDINNLADNQRKQNHLYSDILGSEGQNTMSQRNVGLKNNDNGPNNTWSQSDGKSQKKDQNTYNTKDQKHSQLKSSLDTHNYDASPVRQTEQQDNSISVTIPGKHSMATKLKDLSSDVLGTGNTINHYNAADRETVLVDLDVKGLPAHTQADDLKKISGAKHVISAVVEQDAITNNCVGTGRIKLRLGGEDEVDNVKLQFLKAGYAVQDHTENSKKKPNFTQEQTLAVRSPARKDIDSKATKLQNLQTNNPEIFGNSTNQVQDKYNLNFDGQEVGKAKVASEKESLAINNWSQVGGRR
ncbi:UNKNOWN [Stylonychia lemnae]|uniref:Uncharacterized protein n=1 Tax=Stylonychia lemnae TaxID=5949 RepID=A0A078AZ40_STYLE|nr:UNKNOWN [Stylonychia lemnae]|eukprot:CDW87720.1 UNKNOWN [Stylonychia lemnae]